MDRIEPCAQALAEQLHRALLRHHPDALRAMRELGSAEAEMRALSYLAGVGFPSRRPVSRGRDERRRTPPEVRALWVLTADAVSLVADQLALEPQEQHAVVLSCSWFMHNAGMIRHAWYREHIRATQGDSRRALWDAFDVIGCPPVGLGDPGSRPRKASRRPRRSGEHRKG